MRLTDHYRFAHGERVIDAISIFEEAADLSLTFVYILKDLSLSFYSLCIILARSLNKNNMERTHLLSPPS